MPYQANGVRNYREQYDKYDGKPEQVKNRAKRNAARAMLAKEGVVKKGDGKDVDHKKALSKGGGNGRSNLKAVPAAKNKSFARKSNGAMK